MINLHLGDKRDLSWAQSTVTKYHYLHQPVDPRARPMVYIIGDYLGLIMAGIPHATRNQGWYGYPGLLTQWQVIDLCRIWLNPRIQFGGNMARPDMVPGFVDRHGCFRPTVATWAMYAVLNRIQRDRVSLWPPVFPAEPYHIRLAISYHDPSFHRGFIYREMGWEPMYTDDQGRPYPGASGGKYGWCWRLPEPDWSWFDIEIKRPRTMRLPLGV